MKNDDWQEKGVRDSTESPKDTYAGKGSPTEEEAKKRKRGGRVKKDHKVEGKAPAKRLDRPGRKSGGRVGADKAPLSSAAKASPRVGGKLVADDE